MNERIIHDVESRTQTPTPKGLYHSVLAAIAAGNNTNGRDRQFHRSKIRPNHARAQRPGGLRTDRTRTGRASAGPRSVPDRRAADHVTDATVLALYGGAGFTAELTAAAAADDRIFLVDLDRLYA
jgi:hypothetical protein